MNKVIFAIVVLFVLATPVYSQPARCRYEYVQVCDIFGCRLELQVVCR